MKKITTIIFCLGFSVVVVGGAQAAAAHPGYDATSSNVPRPEILSVSDAASQVPWQLLEELKLAERGLAETSSVDNPKPEKDSNGDPQQP